MLSIVVTHRKLNPTVLKDLIEIESRWLLAGICVTPRLLGRSLVTGTLVQKSRSTSDLSIYPQGVGCAVLPSCRPVPSHWTTPNLRGVTVCHSLSSRQPFVHGADAVEDGSVEAEGTVDAGRQEGPDEFFAEIPGAARAGVKS